MTSTTNSSVGGQQLGTSEALKINSDQEASSNIYLQFEQTQSSSQQNHLEVLSQQHEQHQSQTQITEHQEPTSSDSSTSIKESKRTRHGKKSFLSLKKYIICFAIHFTTSFIVLLYLINDPVSIPPRLKSHKYKGLLSFFGSN